MSEASALLGVVGGLTVLAGWAFGVARLKSVSPGMVSTKPNAALAFALTGASLLVLELRVASARARIAIAMALSAVSGAIGILTLLEYGFGVDVGIDQLIFHESAGAVATAAPGRMAVGTAACVALTGGAVMLVALGRTVSAQVGASVVLAYGFSAMLSYLYGAEGAQPPGTTKISAVSVGALLFLGVALLLTQPDRGPVGTLLRDEPGGLMARWLLVAAALMLPLLGALRLAGQNARLYSASSGIGIMVIASLAVLIATVGITARRLNGLGSERMAALERLSRSEARLRQMLDHLVHVQENERRGLATDLHDDALPALAGVNLQVELAAQRCVDDEVRQRLERATGELRAATARLRHLTFDLLPDVLAREGLGGALCHRLERMRELTAVDYELRDHVGTSVVPQAAAILYRSAVEALRNVARHAHARTVEVTIERLDRRVVVTLADDGVGMGPAPPEPGHMGLSMMRERLELAGGGIDISSYPGAGTTVTMWVPAELSRGVQTRD